MSISPLVSLFLSFGFIRPVLLSLSAPPEDLEETGDDMNVFGSGLGNLLEQGEKEASKDITLLPAKAGEEDKNAFQGSSVRTFDKAHRSAADSRSGSAIVAKSKSFLERKEIVAAVIAGSVTGGILAASLAAVLIYKWQKKDDGGYVLGQQRPSNEDCHEPNSMKVV